MNLKAVRSHARGFFVFRRLSSPARSEMLQCKIKHCESGWKKPDEAM